MSFYKHSIYGYQRPAYSEPLQYTMYNIYTYAIPSTMDITDTLPEINHMPLQNYIPAPIQGPKNSYSKDPLYYKSKYLKNLLDPDYEARKRIKNNYKRTTIKEKKKKSKLKELLDLVT